MDDPRFADDFSNAAQEFTNEHLAAYGWDGALKKSMATGFDAIDLDDTLATVVLLLAEAPDPDADARRALEIALGLNVFSGDPPRLAVQVLATLRDNDYDVTPRAES